MTCVSRTRIGTLGIGRIKIGRVASGRAWLGRGLFAPAALAAFVLSCAAAGCATTIHSKPIGPDATPGARYGVIYQLTRPEFRITRTEAKDNEPSKYQLEVAHVPDSTHRYGLDVDPGLLSTVDLNIQLNEDGSLKSLTSDSKEQFTPTVEAIGNFAVAVIGAASSAAGLFASNDAERDALRRTVGELKSRVAEAALPANTTATLIAAIDSAHAGANGDAAAFRAALRTNPALTQADRDTLVALGTTLPGPTQQRFAAADSSYHAALAAAPPRAAVAEPVNALLAREWGLITDEVNAAYAASDLVLLVRYFLRDEAPVRGVPSSAIGAVKTANRTLSDKAMSALLPSSSLALALEGVNAVVPPPVVPPVVAPPPPTTAERVRKRVAKLLEEIEAEQGNWVDADATGRTRIESAIGAKRLEIAQLTGAEVEYQALVKLEGVLRAGPPAGANVGQGRPMQEYAEAKTQWLALQTDLLTKLERIAKTDAPDPKIKSAQAAPPPDPRTWKDPNGEIAWLWNVQREQMELDDWLDPRRGAASTGRMPAYIPRLLKFKGSDPLATRVESARGSDPKAWPSFVVELTKEVQP